MKEYYIYDSNYLQDIFYLLEEQKDSFRGIMVGTLSDINGLVFIGSDFRYPKSLCKRLELWEVVKYKLEGKIYDQI